MGLTIAIVAGEASGDVLGAGLIERLRQEYPEASFVGIGGPQMLAVGFESWEPMERLSVMGLVEVLGRLPELLALRKRLIQRLLEVKPAIFIGIDSPDFNLPVAARLKDQGIKTAHYVSPSVWAWRPKRIQKIIESVDLMLTLFPFEAAFYKDYPISVAFVGHRLADLIPVDETPTDQAKRLFSLPGDSPVIALVPGSRAGELKRMGPLFFEAAAIMLRSQPNLHFVVPAANELREQEINQQLYHHPELIGKVIVKCGALQSMVTAADAVLIASGTATLETLLLKKPMVVSYRVATLTACMMKRLLLKPFISLPNLLAQRKLVPEILQNAATPERLARYTLQQMTDTTNRQALKKAYKDIHLTLKRDADTQAAAAIIEVLGR